MSPAEPWNPLTPAVEGGHRWLWVPDAQQRLLLKTALDRLTRSGRSDETDWPTWNSVYIELRNNAEFMAGGRRPDEVFAELPHLSNDSRAGYGFVWRSEYATQAIQPGERIGLTMAGLRIADQAAADQLARLIESFAQDEWALPPNPDGVAEGTEDFTARGWQLEHESAKTATTHMPINAAARLLQHEYPALVTEHAPGKWVALLGRSRFDRFLGITTAQAYLDKVWAEIAPRNADVVDALQLAARPRQPVVILHGEGAAPTTPTDAMITDTTGVFDPDVEITAGDVVEVSEEASSGVETYAVRTVEPYVVAGGVVAYTVAELEPSRRPPRPALPDGERVRLLRELRESFTSALWKLQRGESYVAADDILQQLGGGQLADDDVADLIESLQQAGLIDCPTERSIGDLYPDMMRLTSKGREQAETRITGPAAPTVPTERSWDHRPVTPPAQDSTKPVSSRRDVFLVHGRNLAAKKAVEDLLEGFDLRVISWTAAANQARKAHRKSPTTLEIVTAGLEMADAVVILVTPDDYGQLHPKLLSPNDDNDERAQTGQARQNVILEAGMAMGMDAAKVLFVRLGRTRRITDIDGINFVNLGDDDEQRKDLGERLRDGVGVAVDMGRDKWRGKGDFAAALEQVKEQPPFDRASGGDSEANRTALIREIGSVQASGAAQGWKVKINAEGTTLRMWSPRGTPHVFSIGTGAGRSREQLRSFAAELRADGLRLNRRVRQPVE